MLKAISDRIIVKLEKNNNKIVIDDKPEYTNVGIVMSIGEMVRGVKKGDKVLFHLFDELPLPEEGLVVIRQKSLLGIWK